jgi:hypothetical protein
VTVFTERLPAPEFTRLLGGALVAGGVLAATLAVGGLAASDQVRVALTVLIGLLLVVTGLAASRAMLLLLVVWLVIVGLVRRLVSVAAPFEEMDPLLLVGAFGIGVLLVRGLQRADLSRLSGLAAAVLVVQLLTAASALNPSQGGPIVGFAGLLFLLVPTLGFWIGRGLCDDATFGRLLRLVALAGVPVAVYGLAQTLHAFPSWDDLWIQQRGYSGLVVGETIRPFGPFPSSAEYASFLAVSLAACAALGIVARRLAYLLALPVLGLAVFVASARAIIFALAAALVLMTVSRRRLPAVVAGFAALVGAAAVAVGAAALLPAVTDRLASATVGAPTGDLVLHQAEGLANPLDPESSTLLLHLDLVVDGIRSALENPVGVGAGAVTLAARLGGEGVSTEADPSNLAVALGAPGLLVYAALVVLVFTRAYRLAERRRDSLALAALGLLTITFLQWFTGGHYAVAFIVWLTVGWLDRAAGGLRVSSHASRPAR